jgi:protein required for attachment to host cells
MHFSLLSNGTHYVVGDGRKALILVNDGTVTAPALRVESVLSHPDHATHELGSDRPGRAFASIGPRSAATDEPDWHQLAEDEFASKIIQGLLKLAKMERLKHLVIVAPPRTMAKLRAEMPDAFSKLILAEVTKDLTKHPVAAMLEILRAEDEALH